MIDDLGDELDGAGVDVAGCPDLAETLRQMRSLSESARTPDEDAGVGCGPVEIVDQLVDRWQRPAARRGKLLTVEEGDSTVSEVVRWQQLLAVADTLVAAVVRLDGGGSASVLVTARYQAVELQVGGTVLEAALDGTTEGDRDVPTASPARAEMLLASRIAGTVGGTLQIGVVDGSAGVIVTLPQGP